MIYFAGVKSKEPSPPADDGTFKDKSRSSSPTQGDNSSSNQEVVEVQRSRKDLHKTASVFLRTLAPSITKAEVEAVSVSLSMRNPRLGIRKACKSSSSVGTTIVNFSSIFLRESNKK